MASNTNGKSRKAETRDHAPYIHLGMATCSQKPPFSRVSQGFESESGVTSVTAFLLPLVMQTYQLERISMAL